MSPSCNLSYQCQGPGGSGLLTPHSWASSFPPHVEFCPAQALPAGGGRKYMQHSVPAASPRVPHPPGEETAGRQAGPTELGDPWRYPGWGRTVPGASSCAGGGGLGGTRRCQGPFSSPEQPFPPVPQISLAPGRAPGLGFPVKTGDKLPWFVGGFTPCPRLCQGALCVPVGQDGSKGAGSASQEDPGAVPPCPFAAGAAPQPGLKQQHMASEGGQSSQGC